MVLSALEMRRSGNQYGVRFLGGPLTEPCVNWLSSSGANAVPLRRLEVRILPFPLPKGEARWKKKRPPTPSY